MTDDERFQAWAAEYETLCRKYEIIVDGCGCCKSPYPIDLKTYHFAVKEGADKWLADHFAHLWGEEEETKQ